MNMVCDRCKNQFDGDEIKDESDTVIATSGYYQVGPTGQPWGKFANPGETIVCDACMWSDPRYMAVYGPVR